MKYLNVPGLNNSGEHHWQTKWESRFPEKFERVNQLNWATPKKDDWLIGINNSIGKLSSPTILVGHSLGCISIIHWAKEQFSQWITGALLVAPVDIERSKQDCFQTFSPVPLTKLPFPSIVVASMNDQYASIEKAAKYAAYWGSRFICVGEKGHINAQSNLENWNEGLTFLEMLSPQPQPVYSRVIPV